MNNLELVNHLDILIESLDDDAFTHFHHRCRVLTFSVNHQEYSQHGKFFFIYLSDDEIFFDDSFLFKQEQIHKTDKTFVDSFIATNNTYIYCAILLHFLSFRSSYIHHAKVIR
jgi:hypothetical protein